MKQLQKTKSLFLMGLFFALSIEARAEECSINGVWEGSIGKFPITLELGQTSHDLPVGRYFYGNSKEELFIKYDEASGIWLEQDIAGKKTGIFTTFDCQNNTLRAQWQSPNGKRTLSLEALPAKEYKEKWNYTGKLNAKSQTIKAHSYKIISASDGGSSTVQLSGDTPGIAKINAQLMRILDETLSMDSQLASDSWIQRGDHASLSDNLNNRILDWNSRYIVIASYGEGYSGGAHPYSYSGASVYDLDSGEKLDISHWLHPDLTSKYHQIEKESRLGQFLSKQYIAQRKREEHSKSQEESEEINGCLEAISFYSSSSWVTDKGFYFASASSYVDSPCNRDVLVPIDKIMPFLSDEGKKTMLVFRSEK